jgi:integrase
MSARAFSQNEYAAIIDYLGRKGSARDRLLVMLGCATGYRISELLTMRCRTVWNGTAVVAEIVIPRRDLKNGRGVRRGGVRSRRVPLSEPVRSALREYLAVIGTADPEKPLFATNRRTGRAMGPSQAFRVITGAAAGCGVGVSRISCHSMRKTFAEAVYAGSGFDLLAASRILGHSNPNVTSRYFECDASRLDAIVRGLHA